LPHDPSRAPVAATWTLALAVAVAGLVLHGTLGPPDTYWTIDNGGKALALAELRAGRTWIAYPGRDLDPELAFFPQPLSGAERYGQLREGRVLSQYLSPFVALTLPLAALLGFGGLAVLPALGAGACVVLAGHLARRRTGSPAAALGAAGLTAVASPLLFYASVFWEHALVGALATGALVAVDDPRRERATTAGVLLGAACLLREEMALLLLATVAVLAVRGRAGSAARVAGPGAAGVAALALFHRAFAGSWTGVHLGVNRPVPLAHALDALPGLLLGPGLAPVPWLVPALLLAALYALRGRARAVGVPAITLLLGTIAIVAWTAFPGGGDAALALIRSNSALVFVPWVLVAPAGRSAGRTTVAFGGADAIVLVFVLLFVATVPARSITGVHPGPRMLLWPLVPVLAATLAEGIRSAPRRAVALLPVVLVACAWSVRSLDLLHEKREYAGRLQAAIRQRPERLVATPLFWLPTELAALWPAKTFLLAGSAAQARALTEAAREHGEPSLLVADRPGQLPEPPVRSVRSAPFPDLAVDLWPVPLAAAPPGPGNAGR